MLQNFITERAIELENQSKAFKDELAKMKAKLRGGWSRFNEWLDEEKIYPSLRLEIERKGEDADAKARDAMVHEAVFSKHHET